MADNATTAWDFMLLPLKRKPKFPAIPRALTSQGFSATKSGMNTVGWPRFIVGTPTVVSVLLVAFGLGAAGADGSRVGKPRFSPERGFYFTPVDVRVWSETPEAR